MNHEEKLKLHGIRPTAVRLLIMREIEKADHPLSALEIETSLETVDRSTITRTIAILAEADIIHTIHDGSGAAKYELCPAHHHHSPDDNHIHFHCRKCERTFCIPSEPLPHVNIPEGYVKESAEYIITGLCPECSHKFE